MKQVLAIRKGKHAFCMLAHICSYSSFQDSVGRNNPSNPPITPTFNNIFSMDIFQRIPDSEIRNLLQYYKSSPLYSYIEALIQTTLRWRSNRRYKKNISFYSLASEFAKDESFIVYIQDSMHELYIFSNGDCDYLCEAISKTRLFHWGKYKSVLLGVPFEHSYKVLSRLKNGGLRIDRLFPANVWKLPRHGATSLDWNSHEEFYIQKILREHIPIINNAWPHKYKDSEKYLEELLENGCGLGVFLKRDNSLVTWTFQTQIGTIGVLQTSENYKRKGLGSYITKALCKEIARQGLDSIAPVLDTNIASANLFKSLGFEISGKIIFTGRVEKLECHL